MARRNQDLDFFKNFSDSLNANLYVSMFCRVVKLHDSNSSADVQPNALQSDGSKRAMILECPVAKHCRKYIEVGNLVFVVFADRDLDNMTGSGDFTLASRRMHSINDGVILGVF